MPNNMMMNAKQMRELIRSNMREVNRRAVIIKQEEKSEGIKSEFLENQVEIFKAITGTKSERKIATGNISRFNKNKLATIISRQQMFLKSKWSTPEGRVSIREKQLETLRRTTAPDLSDGQFDNLRTFHSKAPTLYYELKARGDLDSEQILDMMMAGYSANQVITALNKINTLSSREIMDISQGHARAFIVDIINNDLTDNPDRKEEFYEIYNRHREF